MIFIFEIHPGGMQSSVISAPVTWRSMARGKMSSKRSQVVGRTSHDQISPSLEHVLQPPRTRQPAICCRRKYCTSAGTAYMWVVAREAGGISLELLSSRLAVSAVRLLPQHINKLRPTTTPSPAIHHPHPHFHSAGSPVLPILTSSSPCETPMALRC